MQRIGGTFARWLYYRFSLLSLLGKVVVCVIVVFLLARLSSAVGATSLGRNLVQADLGLVAVVATWLLIRLIYRKNTRPYR